VTLVRYAEFRRLQVLRQEVNSAIMAMLAGSKLAMNTLQLTAGSTLRLSQIFTRVAHIERFDLRADSAESILDSAEEHLVVMALPYVMALHEHYMLHCSEMLVSASLMSKSAFGKLTPKTMHERFANRAGVVFPVDSLELFHLLRTMRNSLIHQGGTVGEELEEARRSLSQSAEALWCRLAMGSPTACSLGGKLRMTQRDLIACLAVTRFLSERANAGLAAAIPVSRWTEVAVADAVAEGILRTGNHAQRLRRLVGFVRMYYSAIQIPEEAVRAALDDIAEGAEPT
jgi:hypothetical protein